MDLRSTIEDGNGISIEWRRFAELPAPLLYDLLRFRQQIFVVEQRSPYPDLDGLDERASHLLLREREKLAGYLRMIPSPTEFRIGRVAVTRELRRRGLGRQLMRQALRFCDRQAPALPVVLTAQHHLLRFYNSFGFTAVSEPYDDYGLTHIDMLLPR